MNYKTISNPEELAQTLTSSPALMLYFSRNTCNVGESLEPKVIDMVEAQFPKVEYYHVDMDLTPTISAQYSVFVEPTIIVFFDGKESIRKSRIISVPELSQAMQRIYSMMFE